MPEKIPATIIFGFLGAGNTTLIRRFGALRLTRFSAFVGKLMRLAIQAARLRLDRADLKAALQI